MKPSTAALRLLAAYYGYKPDEPFDLMLVEEQILPSRLAALDAEYERLVQERFGMASKI